MNMVHIAMDKFIFSAQLMNVIGNERANSFWERHSQRKERLPADVERDIRENFIRAKYQVKSWIPTPTGESKETLNKLLRVAVKTDNLMRTVELLTLGADVRREGGRERERGREGGREKSRRGKSGEGEGEGERGREEVRIKVFHGFSCLIA